MGDRVYITNRVTAAGRIKNQGDRKATVTSLPDIWKGENTEISIETDNLLRTTRSLKFLNDLIERYE